MRIAGGRSVGRGQAIQLGALLLFAILIINLSLFQVFVVPDQNGEIEFKHSQQVQGELELARSLATQAIASDSELSTSLTLGPQYPSRTLFINPAPPAGTLETVDRGSLVVRGIEPQNGETADAWDGPKSFDGQRALVYRPGYNYYDAAPTTVYGRSVVYNRFDDGTVLNTTGQTLVSGNRITLLSLSGSTGESRTGTATLEFAPTSAPTRRVPVTPDGTFEIEFETDIPESVWKEELLAGERDKDGSDPDAYVEEINCTADDRDDPCGTLTLTFESSGDERYSLRMGQVSVGDNPTDEPASYITRADPTDRSVSLREGETRELTVEVRDAYNNPVSGVTVNTSAAAGSFASTSQRTNEQGQASFSYEAGGAGETLNFTFDGGGPPDSKVAQYDVTVTSTDDGPSGRADPDYGTGGSTSYSNDSATDTVSVPNGQLKNIYSTDELILSGTVPTVDANNQEDRLAYETVLDNGTAKYTVRVKLYRSFDGHWQTRKVKIFDDSGNSQNKALSKEAAAAVYENNTVYEGTDLLDVNDETYADTGSSFERLASEVRGLDDDGETRVTALTTTVNGRVNVTIRQETLFSAVQPQPSDGDEYQFVRVNFETPTNTTDWEIRYEEGSGQTTFPARANVGDLSGEIYFANDESAFETERGLSDDVVYPLNTSLEDADSLRLVDPSGDRRDEVAFEADTDGTPSTTNGWTVSDLGSGEVAVRKNIGVPYRDADNVSDWRVTSQRSFFGVPDSVSVAFVPNSNQKLIRTVTNGTDGTNGTVIDYGEDRSQINILGPKTDLDDDSQDEVLYQVQSNTNGNAIRYMDPDGTVTSVVDRDVRQASAFGVGDPDTVTTVLYATTDGRLTEVEIGGGPPQTVTYTAGNSQGNAGNIKDVRAKGAVGYGDVNGDEDLDPIFVPKDTSKEIGYIDNDSRTTTRIGPGYQIGDGNAVGEPVTIDGNLRVPIVNGSQDLLLVDPADGSIETVNRGTVKPKKSPITVRDWQGDSKKEILVINGNDNQHLYYVGVNLRDETDTADTGEVRDEQAKDKGVQ